MGHPPGSSRWRCGPCWLLPWTSRTRCHTGSWRLSPADHRRPVLRGVADRGSRCPSGGGLVVAGDLTDPRSGTVRPQHRRRRPVVVPALVAVAGHAGSARASAIWISALTAGSDHAGRGSAGRARPTALVELVETRRHAARASLSRPGRGWSGSAPDVPMSPPVVVRRGSGRWRQSSGGWESGGWVQGSWGWGCRSRDTSRVPRWSRRY